MNQNILKVAALAAGVSLLSACSSDDDSKGNPGSGGFDWANTAYFMPELKGSHEQTIEFNNSDLLQKAASNLNLETGSLAAAHALGRPERAFREAAETVA